ncbi:hypothetical protein SEA_ASHERTHEMAN_64 [Gordonia phage Ashertheman]|uniref:Uncharacterized protein n=1 Tax=Gordonia phage Ashertheman TaxID=2301692 RepID=A0A385DUC0_9CAUD|nr:hypothetical protein J1764_gp64 [Gordonia phage Ashertheman]AXQ62971.1 hypothetical protein SEA_ASHERTHEMAN_64 [Gordonia phage Ashertheman]
MSSGQRPRRREYFPRMKVRGKHRPRRPRTIVYDAQWRAVWPQPSRIELVAWTRPKIGRFGGHVVIGRRARVTIGEDVNIVTDIGPVPTIERINP